MRRWLMILPLLALLLASQVSYSLPVEKHLPMIRPDYVFILPWSALILSPEDLAPLIAAGHEKWEAQLEELGAALERYNLQEAADRLWAITEREVWGLAGKPFPSREEGLKTAQCMLDGLIASGVAILKQLIKKAES